MFVVLRVHRTVQASSGMVLQVLLSLPVPYGVLKVPSSLDVRAKVGIWGTVTLGRTNFRYELNRLWMSVQSVTLVQRRERMHALMFV